MSFDLNMAANEIHTADAVVVLGAGASFSAGMPLAGQLTPLVWHALDANLDVLKALCAELKMPFSAAKSVVADDASKIKSAFRHIKSHGAAFRTFKKSICDLDSNRCVFASVPHSALASLVYSRKVIEVISFNWDTLLETAFKRRFGFDINAQGPILTKPHGDCGAPNGEWILPHEEGVVPDLLVKRLNELASSRPRILCIIGYSERDAEVVKKLIQPFAKHWRVIRIGPSATGEGAISKSAAEALELLAAKLTPEPQLPEWVFETFANQRGIEAAISGERLGPQDVQSCPRLPHFCAAQDKLSLLHYVEIAGDSGSGKSVTIWQLAHDLHCNGWQVLRLNAQQKLTAHSLDTIPRQTWRTVVVVDDTQVSTRDLVERLRDTANPRLKVILGTTDSAGEQINAVRSAAKTAVDTLAAFCRKHRNLVLPVVRRFDAHVGDGFLDERIERRLEIAERELTPWQFAYILRGGDRKVHDTLNAVRDFEQADLLLVLIAVRQLATLDAGITFPDLIAACDQIGKNEIWVRTALNNLVRQRTVLLSDVVRCLHLRSAGTIMEASLSIRKGDELQQIITIIRNTLRNVSMPLRGISWLLYRFYLPNTGTIITAEIRAGLISRCISAQTHLEIRDACFVIERLLGRRNQDIVVEVLTHRELIQSWITNADVTDASAIAGVVNAICNDCAKEATNLIVNIDSKIIAKKVSISTMDDGYEWGKFLARLAVQDRTEWKSHLATHLSRNTIKLAVKNVRPQQVGALLEYIHGVASFDFDFALELLEMATPFLAKSISCNALATYRELSDISIWLLGEGLFLDSTPSKRQRNITRKIFDGLNSNGIISEITTCRFGDWEYYARLLAWVRRAYPNKFRAIAQAMKWDTLDMVIHDTIEKPGRELSLLLAQFYSDSKSKIAIRLWLKKHSSRMTEIGSRIVILCPEAACTVISNGGAVNLARDHVSWLCDYHVIAIMSSFDKKTANKIILSNLSHFAKGIEEMSFPEGMSQLLDELFKEPAIARQILDLVNMKMVEKHWRSLLLSPQDECRKNTRKALRVLAKEQLGEIGKLADKVLRQVHYQKRLATKLE